jgi:GNAT superfamily N-acetyltransferase
MIRAEAVSEKSLAGLITLFEESSSTCFCRYWHFSGTKNEWLDRCANRPEENQAELSASIRSEDPAMRGLVAIDEEVVVGWMKLTERSHLPKLRSLPVYRSLDLGPPEASIFSIGCMLVHPKARGLGVARVLVETAGAIARSWGAAAIEAYPRRSSEPLYPEEVWQGPENLFKRAGFVAIHDEGPYPVYRKRL